MQSNNPMLNRAEISNAIEAPMTIAGAINKAIMMIGFSSAVAMVFYFYCLNMGVQASPAGLGFAVGAGGSLILGLIITFKQNTAKTLAMPYALMQGLFMGGVSATYEARYPGLPLLALAATFVTSFGLFALYRAKIIQATAKFKSVVISATLALFILFIVQMVMRLAFANSIPFLFENGMIGIGFAGFVAVIASLNLILDFDMIERATEMQAPKSFEWLCSVALLATLVWMYVSFLRLLGLLSRD